MSDLFGPSRFLVYLLIPLQLLSANSTTEVEKRGRELCSTVKDRCASRVGCGMALQGFYISCQSVSYGYSTECIPMCVRALVTLLLADHHDGLAFINCDCTGSSFCADRKKRIDAACEKHVLKALTSENSSFDVSCNLVRWICEKDAVCKNALSAWETNCSSSLDGTSCTVACNGSLRSLLQYPVGSKMARCVCSEQPTLSQCKELRTCFRTYNSGSSNGRQILISLNCQVLNYVFICAFVSAFRTLVSNLLVPV